MFTFKTTKSSLVGIYLEQNSSFDLLRNKDLVHLNTDQRTGFKGKPTVGLSCSPGLLLLSKFFAKILRQYSDYRLWGHFAEPHLHAGGGQVKTRHIICDSALRRKEMAL